MRKLIVKTIAITLGILIALTSAFYLLLSCCFPKVLSNVYFQIQSEELCLKYSEKAYENSNDIGDLAMLVERSIVFKKSDKVLTHGVSLINDQDYQSYLLTKGDGYHYYLVGNICQVQYNNGDRQTALETAFSNTGEYLAYNPIHKLILLSAQNGDDESLVKIKSHLLEKENKNQLINEHLSLIEQLII